MKRGLSYGLCLLAVAALGGSQINPVPADAITSRAFLNLGTPPNGVIFYCVDCTQTATCAGGGTGAFAYRVAGAWGCGVGSGSFPLLAPNGTEAAPSYSFSSSSGTGLSQSGGTLYVSVAGEIISAATTSGMLVKGLVSGYGALATNGLGYIVDPNTGTLGLNTTFSEMVTNTGDGDGSIVNLPDNPTVGVAYCVVLTVAQLVTVNAFSGETVTDGSTSGTAIAADAAGEAMCLVAATGGSGAIWAVLSKTGTWTIS